MARWLRRRTVQRSVVAMLLALGATGLFAGPASAHAQLVSTDPADGSTLSAPPATVTLTFDEDLLADTETISINDENGNVVASQQATPAGSSVSVPWPADLTTGTYQVAFRVVSGDGHPVMGAITFTIAGAGPSAAASSTPSASKEPSSASATVSSVPVTSSPAPTTESGPSGIAATLVVLGALAVLVLVVVVAVAMIRRRR